MKPIDEVCGMTNAEASALLESICIFAETTNDAQKAIEAIIRMQEKLKKGQRPDH